MFSLPPLVRTYRRRNCGEQKQERKKKTPRRTPIKPQPMSPQLEVTSGEFPPPVPCEKSAADGTGRAPPTHASDPAGVARPGRPAALLPGAPPTLYPRGSACPRQDGGAPRGRAEAGRAVRCCPPPLTSAPCPEDQVAAAAGAQQLARASRAAPPPGAGGMAGSAEEAPRGPARSRESGAAFVRAQLTPRTAGTPPPPACSRGRRPEALCVAGRGREAQRSAPLLPAPSPPAALPSSTCNASPGQRLASAPAKTRAAKARAGRPARTPASVATLLRRGRRQRLASRHTQPVRTRLGFGGEGGAVCEAEGSRAEG